MLRIAAGRTTVVPLFLPRTLAEVSVEEKFSTLEVVVEVSPISCGAEVVVGNPAPVAPVAISVFPVLPSLV